MRMIMKGQQFLDIFAAWVSSLLIYKEQLNLILILHLDV